MLSGSAYGVARSAQCEVLGLGGSDSSAVGAETVHRETAGAKRAAPVAQGFGKCEGIRSDMRDHAFGSHPREQGFTQGQQQVAAFRLVVRIREILHHQGALQLTCRFAVGKHLGGPSGSQLRRSGLPSPGSA